MVSITDTLFPLDATRILLIAVAGFAFLCLIFLTCFVCTLRRSRRRKREAGNLEQTDSVKTKKQSAVAKTIESHVQPVTEEVVQSRREPVTMTAIPAWSRTEDIQLATVEHKVQEAQPYIVGTQYGTQEIEIPAGLRTEDIQLATVEHKVQEAQPHIVQGTQYGTQEIEIPAGLRTEDIQLATVEHKVQEAQPHIVQGTQYGTQEIEIPAGLRTEDIQLATMERKAEEAQPHNAGAHQGTQERTLQETPLDRDIDGQNLYLHNPQSRTEEQIMEMEPIAGF